MITFKSFVENMNNSIVGFHISEEEIEELRDSGLWCDFNLETTLERADEHYSKWVIYQLTFDTQPSRLENLELPEDEKKEIQNILINPSKDTDPLEHETIKKLQKSGVSGLTVKDHSPDYTGEIETFIIFKPKTEMKMMKLVQKS